MMVTHHCLAIIELVAQVNITILKLPPHTTHLLQPFDIAVFRFIKARCDQKLVKWQRYNIGNETLKWI